MDRMSEIDRVRLTGAERIPRSNWRSLGEDIRSNSLHREPISPGRDGCVVAVMAPYSTGHLLTAIDARNPQEGTPLLNAASIMDLSEQELSGFLSLSARVLRQVLLQPDLAEITFGFNFSGEAVRRRLMSIREILHGHIMRLTWQDMTNRHIDGSLRRNGEWRLSISDLVEGVCHDIIDSQVMPQLMEELPEFDQFFTRMTDHQGRLTFRFNPGIDSFSDPRLPAILQRMHSIGAEVYGQVASIFCERDSQTDAFLETENGRYRILDKGQRVVNIMEYLMAHPELSNRSQRMMRILAERLKPDHEIDPKDRDKAWAMKGFSYTMVWSTDNGQDWYFGWDPRVFAAPGTPVSSRVGPPKMFKREPGRVFSPKELAEAEEFEAMVVEGLRLTEKVKV